MPRVPNSKSTTFVQDKDLGFREKLTRLLEADGLEIRAGWLSGRPKYQKDRGGTAVAKVAGVQFGFAALGNVWDQNERRLDSLMGSAEKLIVDQGKNAQNEITKIGIWLAKKIKARVQSMKLVDQGVLISEIRVGLYARPLRGKTGRFKTKSGFGRPKLIQEIAID